MIAKGELVTDRNKNLPVVRTHVVAVVDAHNGAGKSGHDEQSCDGENSCVGFSVSFELCVGLYC